MKPSEFKARSFVREEDVCVCVEIINNALKQTYQKDEVYIDTSLFKSFHRNVIEIAISRFTVVGWIVKYESSPRNESFYIFVAP